MNKISFLLAFLVFMSCDNKKMKQFTSTDNYYQFPDTSDMTNNFYDNTETFPLAVDKTVLREGIMCIAGLDGYRCALSYSELFNRNDQQEFLLVKCQPDADGGLFRVFAAPDFFSDRAIKSVSEIHLN